jgi:hypothetical protein
MYRGSLLAIGLMFTVAAVAAPPGANAADPGFCNQYASDADKSVKRAIHLKCGFTGPRWTKNTSGHFAWCLIVDQGLAESEADARAADLKQCTCEWYADHTMVQIAMNIANKCGFTGLRWLDDKHAHFNWCFNANPPFSAMENELDIRKKMLNGC